MKKYDFFRTSDGHLWAVLRRLEKDDWTPKEEWIALVSTLFLFAVVCLVGVALVLFILSKLGIIQW